MKRLALIVGLHFALGGAWAQGTYSKVTVSTDYPNLAFSVDGVVYRGAATFYWLENSQHYLDFVADKDGFQYDGARSIRYSFGGWSDADGNIAMGDGTRQVVYAQPGLTRIKLDAQVSYLVHLLFWDVPNPEPGDLALCGSEPTGGPGVVLISGTCYARNTEIWVSPGQLTLEAYPYPGWAFVGWGLNDSGPSTFIRTLNVTAPFTLVAYFRPGKRVRFLTEPRGFQVLIDRVATPTPSGFPCKPEELAPAGAAPGAEPLCIGEVDWAVGTTHVIGAPTPQPDAQGNPWVFQSFSNGLGNNAAYEVTSVNPPETIVATFVRGARVGFLTNPTGLKLNINGRDDWLSYNFVAAPGDKFTISAPTEQTGADGRRYVFRGWSNGGDATQEITVPEDAVEKGYRLTAAYDRLSQIVVQSEPYGIPIQVDGEACPTPCSIDRPDGTEVTVVAPAQHVVSHAHRMDFLSWSDGGPRERTLMVSGAETVNLTVRYQKMYLLETSSVPAGGATFAFEPPSADGFFPEGTSISSAVGAAIWTGPITSPGSRWTCRTRPSPCSTRCPTFRRPASATQPARLRRTWSRPGPSSRFTATCWRRSWKSARRNRWRRRSPE